MEASLKIHVKIPCIHLKSNEILIELRIKLIIWDYGIEFQKKMKSQSILYVYSQKINVQQVNEQI